MIKLVDLKKSYKVYDTDIPVLKGINLCFRESEMVAILGQSGCGKTTLLNVVGGLDHVFNGDIIVDGKSTQKFTDADWDAYRNTKVGFVFQNYNLIHHLSVLENVEIALAMSGVTKAERRKKATAVLNRVGLGDHLHKRPNQLSGGQMQRVSIARALINDPQIILADEPTGALDSETSVAVMDILKEISKERLVVLVTHNAELAEKYATRIVKMLDGKVIDDSNPLVGQELKAEELRYGERDLQSTKETVKNNSDKKKKKKKKSMSFFTAFLLSLNNLMTKKGRTFLTSFAGSIGIIGIALILSVSNGVNAYISTVEKSTMASYPLQIQASTMDANSLLSAFMNSGEGTEDRQPDKVYSTDIMIEMMEAVSSGYTSNNLKKFKAYLQDPNSGFGELAVDIKYSYSANLNTYAIYPKNGGFTYKKTLSSMAELMKEIGLGSMGTGMAMMGGSAWSEFVGDDQYIRTQYDLLHGKYPSNPNEVVLIVDENNQVTDYVLYTLGIRDVNEIKEYIKAEQNAQLNGTENTYKIQPTSYSFDEICGYKFKVLLDSDYYKLEGGVVVERTEDELTTLLAQATELSVVGIVAPSPDAVSGVSIGSIGYLSSLMPQLIERVNLSEVVVAQLQNPDKDMFSGLPFEVKEYTLADATTLREQALALNPAMKPMLDMMTDQQIVDMANSALQSSSSTYEDNLAKLGYVDFDKPNSILIYPKDFDAKDAINAKIKEYNDQQVENDKITYSDTVALLMSSVTTIVDAISYVLIAFVAISLVVSSIMIGVITYISVLERTKEIGILRAIGSSKKDVSRVFNAETLIVGLIAGVIGIAGTLILNVVINIILYQLTGLATLKAALPIVGAFILVGISMALTFIAGLIPSSYASKKDPVVALRTE